MKRLMKEAAGVLLFDEPEACAKLKGSEKYPSIQGKVFFYSFWQGTLIAAMVTGLPFTVGDCSGRFFGFHLHEGDTHYNPEGCSHPAIPATKSPLEKYFFLQTVKKTKPVWQF